jgi:hypothetical protein
LKKRSKKLLDIKPSPSGEAEAKLTKVFCFFFSKKKVLSASAQPSRALMWSATRRAFAMIVSVGFTAPMEGKKLPSAT